MPRKVQSTYDPERPLKGALESAGPKPGPKAAQAEKKNYAEKLSRQLAELVASGLRHEFPEITPRASGSGHETPAAAKKLDVKVMDDALGLVLDVSIKTYSFRDYSPSRDTFGYWRKNVTRNDHELRAEATVVHQRQPWAVLVAIIFVPFEACDDQDSTMKSSFVHHVERFSKRAGRGRRPVFDGTGKQTGFVDYGPQDPRDDLFELMFVGLYEPDGVDAGSARFFNVEDAPPRAGRPSLEHTKAFDELVRVIIAEVDRRSGKAPTLDAIEIDDADG